MLTKSSEEENKMKPIATKSLYQDQGYISLLNIMGDDKQILYAARQSTRNHEKEKTEKQDRGLIRYLLRNNHVSPFEQASVLFEVRVPIFIARQLVRHSVIRINEQSARYSEVDFDFYSPEHFYNQDKKNAQKSDANINNNSQRLIKEFQESYSDSYDVYHRAITSGVSKEDARINLPVSMMTNFVFTVSLRGLMHVLELRMHEHAQHQMIELANAMCNLVKESQKFDWTMEAFMDFVHIKWKVQELMNRFDREGRIEELNKNLDTL